MKKREREIQPDQKISPKYIIKMPKNWKGVTDEKLD